jgi:hypothetical protein
VTIALRATVDVVVAALGSAGTRVFRGVGPDDPLLASPYAVIYAGAVETDGPSSAQHADASPEVQITCVGKTSEQVEWLADKTFDALLAASLAPPAGRAWLCPGAPAQHVLSRPITRDDDFGAKAPMFYAVHIFALPTTPA